MNNQLRTEERRYAILPLVLSLEDLVSFVHLSNETVSILASDRSFPLIEIGTQSFILRDSLIDWLRRHERSNMLNRHGGGYI